MRDGQYVHTIIRMYYQQFNFSFAHVQFAIYSCRRNENQQQLADFCATLAANLKMILHTEQPHGNVDLHGMESDTDTDS